ncbi:helix-turn-helix domain-containing protein [Rhizobium sp. BK176]|uniref:helix-turn-helix domain-containing protein n=1 Tax=Rhizobium sp. BK176 TaxID=2587071 RepID=UPI002A424A28|nr:transcriptional regulator with XRE-family HTH domain [Rhizobium sp. BK176]
MNSVSAAIVSRRVQLGITQTEVSRRSGVSQPSISDIEAGATPRNSTLAKLAKALRCQPNDLDPTYGMKGRNTRSSRGGLKPAKTFVDPEVVSLLDELADELANGFGFVPSHLQVIQFLAKKAAISPAQEREGKSFVRSANPGVERD